MEKQLPFEVLTNGKRHENFTNGEVEGFCNDVIVANYLDVVTAKGDQKHEHRQPQDLQTCESVLDTERHR